MTTPHRQIAGLDAWRAAMLLGGVLLHGSVGLADAPLFTAIDMVSQTFRMGAFFAIAGVLSGLALERHAPASWMRRRLVQLGVPLGFAMATVPPAIWALARVRGWPGPVVPLPFEWYHLWFLAALLLYSAVPYALARRGHDRTISAWIEDAIARRRLRASTVLLVTACAVATLFWATPRVMAAMLPVRLFDAFRTLQLAGGYLPMFLLGYLAIRAPGLGALLVARFRVAATIVAAVALSYAIWFGVAGPAMDVERYAAGTALLRFVAAAVCPPAVFALILRSSAAVTRVPVAIARLSAASYTIYLLHLPIAVAINLALRPFALDPYLSYAIALAGSGVLSFLVHERGVRRSATLALLLNGRLPPRRPRQSAYLTEQP